MAVNLVNVPVEVLPKSGQWSWMDNSVLSKNTSEANPDSQAVSAICPTAYTFVEGIHILHWVTSSDTVSRKHACVTAASQMLTANVAAEAAIAVPYGDADAVCLSNTETTAGWRTTVRADLDQGMLQQSLMLQETRRALFVSHNSFIRHVVRQDMQDQLCFGQSSTPGSL